MKESEDSEISDSIDGEDGETEETETSEESDDEEPKLKYQRLGADVIEILKNDVASCMAVSEKLLALGTHYGFVFILDFNGNQNQKFENHSSSINEISIDSSQEYIATCSDEGKVVIRGLFSNEVSVHQYGRPILAFAFDPNYAKTKQFVCGGKAGELLMSTKGLFGFGSKNQCIHKGEGPIRSIVWRGSLIAWANDMGVKIYDCTTSQKISYIERSKGSERPDLYRCHLNFENDSTIIIAWGNSVKIGKIKERRSNDNLPSRFVEIVALFQTDFVISGIAPFDSEYLLVLAYSEKEEKQQVDSSTNEHLNRKNTIALRPELRVINRKNEEISSDALPIQGFERYQSTDYRLDYMAKESIFYIVSPKDIVVGKPRDLDDHIQWLVEHHRFAEALKTAQENELQLKRHNPTDLGQLYLDHLIKIGKMKEAAELCPRILGNSPQLWEKWIYIFVKEKHLEEISTHIPIANPTLNKRVYELVLNYFLECDQERFLETIKDWPSNLYDIQTIINVLSVKEQTTGNDKLTDALAILYTYDKQYDKTLKLYLKLKKGEVFKLIKEHKLYNAISEEVLLLLEFDQKSAVELLVEKYQEIPISGVVKQLKEHEKLLFIYLNALIEKYPNEGADFHESMVRLYSQYDYPKLLPFLKQSQHIPLHKALEICEEKNLYPEMVFIHGRMGNTTFALNLIIEKIRDVKKAIEFAETHHDDKLWEQLIDQSLKNPHFIGGLLENIGTHIDPILLIKRIPNSMEIPQLRDRLVKIISDYNLKRSLREGCNTILKVDCVQLQEKISKKMKRGFCVPQSSRCAGCNMQILYPERDIESVVVFFCNHTYHTRCLKNKILHQQNSQPQISNINSPQQKQQQQVNRKQNLFCEICYAQKKNQHKVIRS
eukprot:TRINITY_DN3820_c0_g1_i1.p1 TRINITY_DN3820_c0_g1~~TRINITY_DN3820_c0_g1_i1.p1  ORF type:complete len:888 (-),score=239.42 TRINITY_DN3820_c0_g1_i1:117-2780(-)